MAFQELSFRSLLFACTIYWFACASERLACAYRFGNTDPLYQALLDILIAGVVLFLGCRHFRSQKSSGISFPVWTQLAQYSRSVGMFRAALMTMCSIMVLGATAFLVWCSIFHHASRAASCVADVLGYDLLAEQIYCLNPDLGADQSLGIWQTSFMLEPEILRLKRNGAVAAVHGPDSLQLARRYYFVGTNIEMTTGPKKPYPLEAYYWFFQSYVLYWQNNDYEGCIDSLCQMSLVMYDNGMVQEAKALIVHASKFFHGLDAIGGRECLSSREMFSYLITKVGLSELSSSFAKPTRESCRSELGSDIIPIVLLGLCAGFSAAATENLLLRRIYADSKDRLSRSMDEQSLSDALNKLIAIELYCGNIGRASEHSRNLLKVVGLDNEDSFHYQESSPGQRLRERRTVWAMVNILILFLPLFYALTAIEGLNQGTNQLALLAVLVFHLYRS